MFIRYRFSELIRVLRLTVVVVVRDTGSGGQAGTAEPVASFCRGFRGTLGEWERLWLDAQTLKGRLSKQRFLSVREGQLSATTRGTEACAMDR